MIAGLTFDNNDKCSLDVHTFFSDKKINKDMLDMYSDVAHGMDRLLDGATCGGHQLYLVIIVLFSFPKHT